MNARIWGIIGGVALVLALLSPFVLGSAQKVERLLKPLRCCMKARNTKRQSKNIKQH